MTRIAELTSRQQEIAEMVIKGLSSKEVGRTSRNRAGNAMKRAKPKNWTRQIKAIQAQSRRLMRAETNACPECGVCSTTYKRMCIRHEKCGARA